MQRIIIFLIFVLSQLLKADGAVFLDWESAWERVCDYAPALAELDAEIAIREGETLQVSLLPNPVALVEAENIGVGEHNDEVEPPEVLFAISQLIELGGKRGARHAFANSITQIAFLDLQIERQNLYFDLRKAFIDVGYAQEKVNLAQERVRVANEMVQALTLLVEGGKVSYLQQKKSELHLMSAEMSWKEACSELSQLKNLLAGMWGGHVADFDCVEFELRDSAPPLCESCAVEALFNTPDFAQAQQMVFSSERDLNLQKANSIPDLTINFGYSVFTDSGDGGWLIGAEMPIPFFNRNQGNIKRASASINRAGHALDELVREMTSRIIFVRDKAASAYEESQEIKANLLEGAIETYKLMEVCYLNGKLEYIELLEAEKMLFEVEEHYLAVLYNYHQNLAELARLTGAHQL